MKLTQTLLFFLGSVSAINIQRELMTETATEMPNPYNSLEQIESKAEVDSAKSQMKDSSAWIHEGKRQQAMLEEQKYTSSIEEKEQAALAALSKRQ